MTMQIENAVTSEDRKYIQAINRSLRNRIDPEELNRAIRSGCDKIRILTQSELDQMISAKVRPILDTFVARDNRCKVLEKRVAGLLLARDEARQAVKDQRSRICNLEKILIHVQRILEDAAPKKQRRLRNLIKAEEV